MAGWVAQKWNNTHFTLGAVSGHPSQLEVTPPNGEVYYICKGVMQAVSGQLLALNVQLIGGTQFVHAIKNCFIWDNLTCDGGIACNVHKKDRGISIQ